MSETSAVVSAQAWLKKMRRDCESQHCIFGGADSDRDVRCFCRARLFNESKPLLLDLFAAALVHIRSLLIELLLRGEKTNEDHR